MNTETVLSRELKSNGFTLARSKKHRCYKDLSGRLFVMASTPSDHLASDNSWSQFRRLVPTATKQQDDRPLRATRTKTRLAPMQADVLTPIVTPVVMSKEETKRLRKEERLFARWEAEDHEARRQRGLLRDYFEGVVEIMCDAFWKEWEKHDKSDETYQDSLGLVLASIYAELKTRGFNPTVCVGSVTGDGIPSTSFFLTVHVSGFYLDFIENQLHETSKWLSLDGSATCEVYGELTVKLNKQTGMANFNW